MSKKGEKDFNIPLKKNIYVLILDDKKWMSRGYTKRFSL